jgi:hypothetical protein
MRRRSSDDLFVPPKRREARPPHAFVLEALAALEPTTRPMFGCLAVYVDERIVLILREKQPADADDGVWIATTPDHHASLRLELPAMRSIAVLGTGTTGWQVLPATAPDFEEAALHACALIVAGDPRIGKVPKPRRVKRPGESRKSKSAEPRASKGTTGEAKKTAPKRTATKGRGRRAP